MNAPAALPLELNFRRQPASLLGRADRCACVTPASHFRPVTVFHQSALSSQLPVLLDTSTQGSDFSCGGCYTGDGTSRFLEQEKPGGSTRLHVKVHV